MFSTRDVFRILFRQKFRIALAFISVIILTVLGVLFLPRQYSSEMQLYIRVGRENVTVDPIAQPGEQLNLSTERLSEVVSMVEILRSRGIREAVVREIGAEQILAGELSDDQVIGTEVTPLNSASEAIGGLLESLAVWMDGRIPPEERAVRELSEWVEVSTEKKATVIRIGAITPSPRLSQRVVQEMVKEFERRHIEAHKSKGSMEFFEQQRDRVKQQLELASQHLRDEKNAVGVVSVNVERDLIRSEITNLNSSIASAASSLEESRDRLTRLSRRYPTIAGNISQVGVLPEEQNLATGQTSTSLDSMRADLFELQLRERELASRLLPGHPDRKALKTQLEEAQLLLAEQEILLESSNINKWQSRLTALERKMEQSEGKLLSLNRSEVRVKKAEDEVSRLYKAYNQYEENYEVAMIDRALEEEQITNVRPIGEATLQFKPVAPKKMLLAALGLMGAFVVAAAVGIASEYLDPTFKTVDEVESRLGVPVLVSIPRVSRHRVRMN